MACEAIDPCSKSETSSWMKWVVAGAIALFFAVKTAFEWWTRIPLVDEPAIDDPRLLHAQQKARATIDEFWKHFNDPTDHEDAFALKVVLETEHGGKIVWLHEISEREGQLFGRFVDEDAAPELVYGQMIRFNEEQICDWAFMRDDRVIGNFSIAIMMSELNDRHQKMALRDYGWGDNDLKCRLS